MVPTYIYSYFKDLRKILLICTNFAPFCLSRFSALLLNSAVRTVSPLHIILSQRTLIGPCGNHMNAPHTMVM